MLILTRRVGETIRIGHDILIKHLGHRGDASRIGIIAPKSVSVDRQEIYEKKFNESNAESKSQADSVSQLQAVDQPKIIIKKKRMKTVQSTQ